MDARRLGHLSKRHGGLFTRQDAQRCGYTVRQIRRRILNGEWVHVFGQVLAPVGLALTPLVRDTAAHLAVPGSVLAGPSAARRWRIPVSDQGTYLYVGPNGRPPLPGVRQWRDRPDGRDVVNHGIVPITWRPQTIVDCLRLLPEQEAFQLIDRALLQRWITMDDFVERVQRQVGRKDVGKLVSLVRAVADGTRSVAERATATLLRQHGITGWTANSPVRDADGLIGLCDFVFDAAKLIVEVDGLAFHQDPARFVADRQRQNRLLRAGWRLVRITWYDLQFRPNYVISEIRSALAAG